jgi:hypothetical protein
MPQGEINMPSEFRTYPRKGHVDARPYVPGEDLTGISVSPEDRKRSSLDGGFIARNPLNHADKWYIAPEFFHKNYGDPL